MLECDRQKKVLNMLITCHSVLRDRYLMLSAYFENGLLVASVILNALVFIDASLITKFTSLSEDAQKLLCGILSITVFAISVVLLQVKWKKKAEQHSEAAAQLFLLLQELREILQITDEDIRITKKSEFNIKYGQISATLTQIPDRKFNELKLKHNRKVELSKLIDKYPGSILIILKLKLLISSFKKSK